MTTRSTLDSIIIFLSLSLVIFHTFTFLRLHYSFIVTLAIFSLIVLLYLIRGKGLLYYDRNPMIMTVAFFMLIVIFIGIIAKRTNIVNMVGAYLPFLMWPMLYSITEPMLNLKSKKRYIVVFTVFLAISMIATLVVVISDNDASRLLAGAASESVGAMYYKKGVGGYGFIYGCAFVIYSFMLWFQSEKNKLLKIALLAIVITSFMMILYASYTIAFFIAIVSIFLSFIAKSNNKKLMLILLVVIILLAVLLNPILSFIKNIATELELHWIEKRVGQLINAEATGNISTLKRVQLYSQSLKSFFSNILIGGDDVGGHSFLFDIMGRYGLGGLLFGVAYYGLLYKMKKFFKGNIGLIYIVFMVFLTINTMDTIVLLPMVTYMLPLILSFIMQQEGNYEKNITD